MEKKTIDILIILGILVALGIIIYVAIIAKSEGGQCQISPLVYGAKKLSEANGAEFQATGYFLKPNSPMVTFNSKNISITLNNALSNRQEITNISFDFLQLREG